MLSQGFLLLPRSDQPPRCRVEHLHFCGPAAESSRQPHLWRCYSSGFSWMFIHNLIYVEKYPVSLAVTRSQTSYEFGISEIDQAPSEYRSTNINSQFSDVSCSSVAFAISQSDANFYGLCIAAPTNCLVKGILLRSKHALKEIGRLA